MEGTQTIVDSGDNVYDMTYTGGRVGVYVYNQSDVSWSDLVVHCKDPENKALQFDGVDDYVSVANVTDLGMEQRYGVNGHHLKLGRELGFKVHVTYIVMILSIEALEGR